MAEIHVTAERPVGASAGAVYGILADYRQHHPHILPPAFTDFRVESGGVGDGTIVAFTLNAGRRVRPYRMRVEEPEPGRVLRERDTGSSLVTTFTVEPRGETSFVRIDTRWQGSSGIGGFMERTFAPRVLQRLYLEELDNLDRYAREHKG